MRSAIHFYQLSSVSAEYFKAILQCESTAYSGSIELSTATVMKTLFKSRHIVYSERPSPSLCGNLN